MISVLLPTRRRPAILTRMIDSALMTAETVPEFCVYIDEVEGERVTREKINFVGLGAKFKLIEAQTRLMFTDLWNPAYAVSTGDILMLANDDIIFRTVGWDSRIEQEFAACPDKIIMVHGDDMGGQRERFGPHPFISRRWVEAVGYFSPPWFCGDCNDTWVNDVANMLGRRKFIPVQIEHCHWVWGKAPMDSTYKDRENRSVLEKPRELYESTEMAARRRADADKLLMLMDLNWSVL